MPMADADDPRVMVVAETLRKSAAQPGAGTYGTDARRILAALDAARPDDQAVVDAAITAYLDAPRDAEGRISLADLMRHVATAVREAL